MRNRVRVLALGILLMLLLGGLLVSGIVASLSASDAPVVAASRSADPRRSAQVADLAGDAVEIPEQHMVLCRVVDEEGTVPKGARCRFAFVRTHSFPGVDKTLPVGAAPASMRLPEGAVGVLTGSAPGYLSKSQDLGVWAEAELVFELPVDPSQGTGTRPEGGSPEEQPAPPAPPAPPPPPPPPPPPASCTHVETECEEPPKGGGGGGGGGGAAPGFPPAPPPPPPPPPPPQPPVASRFGRPGTHVWDQYTSTSGAGEPTIGISWKGARFDNPWVLMQFNSETRRVDFGQYVPGSFNPSGQFPLDASGNEVAPPAPAWVNTNNANSVVNVDPYLWTDPFTGRTWAGGLNGYSSVFGMSDNDGLTWQPTPSSPASGAGWDHESLATGPYATPVPVTAGYPASGTKVAVYYCSQTPPGVMSCSRSDDGGVSWAPTGLQGNGMCGGLHGHPRVSQIDGSVYVPARGCGGKNGMMFSRDNGATWSMQVVAASNQLGGFDPAIGISEANANSAGNVMYYAQGDNSGIHVAKSVAPARTDLGTLPLGVGNGVNGGLGSGWLDLGALVNPPIVRAVFPAVEVGDDNRAAVTFMGSTQAFNHDDCDPTQIWHYYLAVTYDGGVTWNVQVINNPNDPVQRGGVWSGGGSNPCRNLLDFNGMAMDAHGRLYVGFGDGCVAPACTATGSGQGATNLGAILRQRTGCGLFHAFDEPGITSDCKLPQAP